MNPNPSSTPTNRPVRVYYLASGAIAVPVIGALHRHPGIFLSGCGTQPDQPSGRRRTPRPTPVADWCAANGIEVDKWSSVNTPEATATIAATGADIILVFAFGQVLRQAVLDLPRCACVNIHASLLPRYRGAAPVSAAIVAGDRQTGISIMQMVRALDAGPVYRQSVIRLNGSEYLPEVEERLAAAAASEIGDALCAIADGVLAPVPQDDSLATYANKLAKRDGAVDWHRPAAYLERQVRAYYPWPGTWFVLGGRKPCRVTVTAAAAATSDSSHPPGTVVQADNAGWSIACGEGVLNILECVPEGKRKMSGIEFLRGHPVQVETRCYQDETTRNQQ